MRYLIDEDGNVVKAHIVSKVPEGYTDITDGIEVNNDADGLASTHIEQEWVLEVPAVEEVIEHWTDGTDIVYDVNDIPTLVDGNGDPYLDPNYSHVAAVAHVPAIPAHYRIKKTATADQELRQITMDSLDVLRQPLLSEADIEINRLEDNSGDSSAWRTYRQELRDITEPYKDNSGDWVASVDTLDVENFTFPTKP